MLDSSLDLVDLAFAENFFGGSLDDSTGDGEAGALLEVEINLASGLSAFVDTPIFMLALRKSDQGRNQLTRR